MRITYFVKIRMFGNSHVLLIPREVRTIIEAKRGDLIRVEVEKVNEDVTNLHVNDAARQGPKTRDKGIHQEE